MPCDIPKPFADQIARIPSCSSHKVRKPVSQRCISPARCSDGKTASLRVDKPRLGIHHAALLMVVIACVALTGCGSGGYAGGGITSLSSSAITIDAGQSIQITASLSGNAPVLWTMGGGSCSAFACGALSTTAGTSVTYTAPAGITTQMKFIQKS